MSLSERIDRRQVLCLEPRGAELCQREKGHAGAHQSGHSTWAPRRWQVAKEVR